MAGFFLLGSLLGLLGSLLVVWQYHLGGDPRQAGLHFLAVNLGFLASSFGAGRAISRGGARLLAQLASVLATFALAALPLVAPPTQLGWRLGVMSIVGIAAGGLATAVLQRLQHSYQGGLASALTRTGLLFSAGSLFVTAVTGTIYSAGPSGWEIALLAAIPLATLWAFLREPAEAWLHQPHRTKTRNLRAVASVLLSLLLFFQFGNEWAVAGWLPILLIRRLGTEPVAAILALALYFLFVALGRVVAQAVLAIVGHRGLLLASIVMAIAGYGLLAFTHTISAAFTGIVLIGFGFGPIFPLLGESLGGGFVFQPGPYNGIFAFAITGAMAAPWLLGYVFEYFGTDYLLLVPAFGSVLVFLLACLLMLESRLMRGKSTIGPGELLY